MSKKKKSRPRKPAPGQGNRIDPVDYGIDLRALLEEIKPHLDGMTSAEIGEAAGLRPTVIFQLLNGTKPPSLGSIAALAKASGGRLSVTYQPSGAAGGSPAGEIASHDADQSAGTELD